MGMISTVEAMGWSVFGATLAYVLTTIVPELVRQMRKEQADNTRFRPTGLTWIVGFVLLACAVGIGVGVVAVFSPCSAGDAWIGGLGSISFIASLLGLGNQLVPRD
jgi:hypothetical protein